LAQGPSDAEGNYRRAWPYGNLFEEWEIATTRSLVAEFCGKWSLLKQEGFEDLIQECLTHWYFAKGKYDSKDKASMKTFMRRVTRNKLADIVKRIYREKRKAPHEILPLDESILIEKDGDAIKAEDDVVKSVSDSELNLSLQKVFQKLSPEQQKLCKLLYEEGMNINEASKHFKMHRRTIYKEIDRIRKIFEKEGLRDYLR